MELVDMSDFMTKIYQNFKVYGPYKSKKDNRLRVVLVDNITKNKQTISYPKYLIEIELNRYLAENETVHHKDGNPLNNDLSNLIVLDRNEHIKFDAVRRLDEILICQWCGKEFLLEGKKLYQRSRKDRPDKSNSFCSKICIGKYGKHVQISKIKFDKIHIKERYIRNSMTGELNIGETLTFKDDGNTEA